MNDRILSQSKLRVKQKSDGKTFSQEIIGNLSRNFKKWITCASLGIKTCKVVGIFSLPRN